MIGGRSTGREAGGEGLEEEREQREEGKSHRVL